MDWNRWALMGIVTQNYPEETISFLPLTPVMVI